jgi:hypothetical protein
MKTRLGVGIVALACGAMTVACGSQNALQPPPKTFELRIYDPANNAKAGLTVADVVRSSARAESGETAGSGLLYFRFTRAGVLKFRRLTRELARRGSRVHRLQRLTIEINHRVYERPTVDYRVFPDGLDASQGLEIDRLTLSVASRLAQEIRNAS